jgi:hypothetical protein
LRVPEAGSGNMVPRSGETGRIHQDFANGIFFPNKPIFERDNWYIRQLHVADAPDEPCASLLRASRRAGGSLSPAWSIIQ